MAQDYNVSGRYSVESVSITNFDESETLDLRFIVDSLVIEESIFNACLVGYIDVNDSTGIHHDLPIFGQETLEIVFSIGPSGTSDDTNVYPKIKLNFAVYKMANKREISANSCTYRLYFCSQELLTNETVRISKSYKGLLISDIVQDAFGQLQSSKNITVDSTINAQRIVVPYQTPFQLINWIAPFAIHDKFQASSYFFYETFDGFFFRNLEEMYQQDAIDTYSRVVKQTEDVQNTSKDRGIDSIQFPYMFDLVDTMTNGAYGSTLQTYDIMTRSYGVQQYNYATNYTDTSHIEAGSIDETGLLTSNSDLISSDSCRKTLIISTPQIQSRYVQSKNEDAQTYSKHREDVILPRIAQIAQLSSINSTIDIPGDTRLRAGSIIKFKVPPFGFVNSKSSQIDQYYTGNYLIKKIIHKFVGAKYVQTLEIGKDTVAQKRQNVNPKTNAQG